LNKLSQLDLGGHALALPGCGDLFEPARVAAEQGERASWRCQRPHKSGSKPLDAPVMTIASR
jgi:hypothetical protein